MKIPYPGDEGIWSQWIGKMTKRNEVIAFVVQFNCPFQSISKHAKCRPSYEANVMSVVSFITLFLWVNVMHNILEISVFQR